MTIIVKTDRVTIEASVKGDYMPDAKNLIDTMTTEALRFHPEFVPTMTIERKP